MAKKRAKPSRKKKELVLGTWGTRFVAWFIDSLVIAVITELVRLITPYRFSLASLLALNIPYIAIDLNLSSIIAFFYWTLLEGQCGRSLGKKVMNLKVVDIDGNKISYISSAIESLGKAFILPLDVLIGLMFFNEKRQRLFNRLSDTVVISEKPKKSKIIYKKKQ